jgi:hypothetical protein
MNAVLKSQAGALEALEPGLINQPESDDPELIARRTSTLRHLISTMLLGQMYNLTEDVEPIYSAVSETTGEGQQLRISLAFASAMAGDALPAKALLAEVTDHDWPESEMAQGSIAIALKIAGDPDWRAIPERILASSINPSARQFSSALLAQM